MAQQVKITSQNFSNLLFINQYLCYTRENDFTKWFKIRQCNTYNFSEVIMLDIAICDDELLAAQQIEKNVAMEFKKKNVDVNIKVFTSGQKLIEDFTDKPFDVIFLDIYMPDISGFSVAKRVREICNDTYIIFITVKDDLVFDSFDYYPFQFIRKETFFDPDISKNDHVTQNIRKTIHRLIEHISDKSPIVLQDVNKKQHLIFPGEIEYIESDKHYLNYYLAGIKEPLRERAKISEKCAELSNSGIIRIQKKYAVNLKHVKFIDNEYDQIIMKSRKKLPISKTFKNQIKESFKLYLRNY